MIVVCYCWVLYCMAHVDVDFDVDVGSVDVMDIDMAVIGLMISTLSTS